MHTWDKRVKGNPAVWVTCIATTIVAASTQIDGRDAKQAQALDAVRTAQERAARAAEQSRRLERLWADWERRLDRAHDEIAWPQPTPEPSSNTTDRLITQCFDVHGQLVPRCLDAHDAFRRVVRAASKQ